MAVSRERQDGQRGSEILTGAFAGPRPRRGDRASPAIGQGPGTKRIRRGPATPRSRSPPRSTTRPAAGPSRSRSRAGTWRSRSRPKQFRHRCRGAAVLGGGGIQPDVAIGPEPPGHHGDQPGQPGHRVVAPGRHGHARSPGHRPRPRPAAERPARGTSGSTPCVGSRWPTHPRACRRAL